MKLLNQKKISILLVIEYLLYIIFFIGLIWRGYAQAYYQTPLQWLDDFQWLSWFYRIGYGEIPYKDFFVLYGPLLPYIFSIPFKLFGSSFFSWNIIRYILLPVVCYVIAIIISKKIFKTGLFTIIFLLTASTYDAWGFFFLQPWMFRIWMGLFTIVIVFSKLRNKYFLSGLWLALLFFMSIDQGVYVFLTLLGMTIFLIILSFLNKINIGLKPQKIYSFITGLVLFLSIPIIILLITGGLENYLRFSFTILPHTEISSFGLLFPDFPISKLKTSLFSFIISKEFRYYLPIFVYFTYFLLSLKSLFLHLKINWLLLFITFYGIFSFRTALGRSDFGHLMSVSVPAVYLIIRFAEYSCQRVLHFFTNNKNHQFDLPKTLLFIICVVTIFPFIYLTRSSIEEGFFIIISPNKIINTRTIFADSHNQTLGVNMNVVQSKALDEAVGFLKSMPDKQFYEHGALSGLYYLTGTRNPFYFDQDFWATEEQQKKNIERLEKENNQFIVTLSKDIFFRGSLFNDYLMDFYAYYNQFGDLVIWKRNDKIFNDNFSGVLVDSIWGQWQNSNLPFTFEISLKNTAEINKVKLALKLAYLPFLSFFAKTQARLGLIDETNTEEWFSPDTLFVPKYSPDGQLVFHLYKNIRIKKLFLEFSSPGGLNPRPADIKIERTWLIK